MTKLEEDKVTFLQCLYATEGALIYRNILRGHGVNDYAYFIYCYGDQEVEV